MLLSSRVLGSTTVRDLSVRAGAVILAIGGDKFTRAALAKVQCFNFLAAVNLSRAIERELPKVKDTVDLFEHVPPASLITRGVGSIAIAVLGAAFEVHDLGGTQPLEAWVARHRAETETEGEFVTIDTLKHRQAKREVETEAMAKRIRKHARRDTAHRIRVDRFTKRRGVSHGQSRSGHRTQR